MRARSYKPQKKTSKSIADNVSKNKGGSKLGFEDNRSGSIQMRELQDMVNTSLQAQQLSLYQKVANTRKSKQNAQIQTMDTLQPAVPVQTKVIQRAGDSEEIDEQAMNEFNYQDIINWDGSPCLHHGILFRPNENIRYMCVSGPPYLVQYNPNDVGPMSPQARYFMIMHEVSHLRHQHPGNDHPDSVQNETQADDTALVNAMTYYPEKSNEYVPAASDFFQEMHDREERGGDTHPHPEDRRNRTNALYNAILDLARVEVNIWSPKVSANFMRNFLHWHGDALLIQKNDVFWSPDNKGAYIKGKGEVSLRMYLLWLNEFNNRCFAFEDLSYNKRWARRPVDVQNEVKDEIPGGLNYNG